MSAAIIAAIIGAVASIAAAVIAARVKAPASPGPLAVPAGAPMGAPAQLPLSKAVLIGGLSCVLWILPILAYLALPFGFWFAMADRGSKRGTTLGLILCVVALVLALANGAWGQYEQAHGTGWWQTG